MEKQMPEPDIYVSCTDEELFAVMSLKEKNELRAQDAYRIFYSKYKNFLWSLCCSVCRNMGYGDTQVAKDLFMNTMIAAYHYSYSYDSSKGKVKTWLSGIAKNQLFDLMKLLNDSHLGEKVDISPGIALNIPEPEVEEQTDSPEKDALRMALKILSDKEREILLTYFTYQDGNRHLPDEVVKHLCQRFKTTSANLRKIKQRSMEKIRNYMLQHTDLLAERKS